MPLLLGGASQEIPMLPNVHRIFCWGRKKSGSDIKFPTTVTLRGVRACDMPSRSKAIFSKKVHTFRDLNHHRTASASIRREIMRSGIAEQQVWQEKSKKPYAETPQLASHGFTKQAYHPGGREWNQFHCPWLCKFCITMSVALVIKSNKDRHGIGGKQSTKRLSEHLTSGNRFKSFQITCIHMCIWNVGESLSKLFRQQIRRTHLYLSRRTVEFESDSWVTWFTWLPCWLVPDFSAFDFHDSPFFTTMILTPWSQSNRICPAGQWPNSL